MTPFSAQIEERRQELLTEKYAEMSLEDKAEECMHLAEEFARLKYPACNRDAWKVKYICLLRACACCSAFLLFTVLAPAQPANFAAAGLGFQKIASRQNSGWSELCHRNPNVSLFGMSLPSYTCAATDYTGAVTSARVEIDTALIGKENRFYAGTKTGGGAALNTQGVGGSFSGGIWAAVNIAGWTGVPGLHLVSSVTWTKDDVAAQTTLRQIAGRAVVRMGIGRSW